MLGHHPQRELLSPTADHERRPGLLDRLWLAVRLLESVLLPLEVRHWLRPEAFDYLAGLVQATDPLCRRRKLDPVRLVLELEPGGAQAHFEPPAGDDVQTGAHLGQHGRMAVGDAG